MTCEFQCIFNLITEDEPPVSAETNLSEDLTIDPENDPQRFISILLESLFVLRKIPDAAEVCIVYCILRLE